MTSGLEVMIQLVCTIIAALAVLGFGCPAFYIAVSGQTMMETNFPMKEYVQIKPAVYCPLGPGFYSFGWRQNIRDILGQRWLRRLLIPTRGGPVDLQPAIAPQPSAAGVAALMARVHQVEEFGVASQVNSVEELGINPGPGDSSAGV
mmetsp:Transcript_33674/g.73463  ORF Transcript_33674/g.73463 Transcript_33674/m.73463 type:complete len:147 (+) Transcript_33674:1-441(+)